MGLFDRFRRPARGVGPAAVRARLEGAMSQRRLRSWNPPLENINSLVASGGPRLLARARELVVTNGYAGNACEAFASNIVGDGIKPSSLIEDAGLRDRVQRLWLAWIDEADSDGLTDFYGLQAMVAREMFVAGECFVRLRPRRALLRDGRPSQCSAHVPPVPWSVLPRCRSCQINHQAIGLPSGGQECLYRCSYVGLLFEQLPRQRTKFRIVPQKPVIRQKS